LLALIPLIAAKVAKAICELVEKVIQQYKVQMRKSLAPTGPTIHNRMNGLKSLLHLLGNHLGSFKEECAVEHLEEEKIHYYIIDI